MTSENTSGPDAGRAGAAERSDRSAARGAAAELALALQFLTSCPEILRRPAAPEELGRSAVWFPLVGALLGLALGAGDALLGLAFAEPLRSALVVVAMVLLTRGLHLDGLIDTCDGLFGGWSPERRLEIMRDSRVGTFGALAGAGDLLVRVAALSALPEAHRLSALVVAAALGRWSLVYATWAFPYARPTGMGAAFKAHLSRRGVLAASALAVAVVALAPVGPELARGGAPTLAGLGAPLLRALLATLVAGGAAWGVGRYVLTKIPGQTGDTYGATNEVVELAVLLALSTKLWGSTMLWGLT